MDYMKRKPRQRIRKYPEKISMAMTTGQREALDNIAATWALGPTEALRLLMLVGIDAVTTKDGVSKTT